MPTETEAIIVGMETNKWAKFEDKADFTIPSGTNQVYNYIGEELMSRDSTDVMRCSAATMCLKRRQLQRMGTKGTPLTPRKLVNFMLGDLTEKVLNHFIKKSCVGEGKMYSEVVFGDPKWSFPLQGEDVWIYDQPTWHNKINEDISITGHPDGVGKRNSDGKWELIEIKSAANWGFNSYKKDGPGDYLKQAHALMMCDEAMALGIGNVRFWYLRKETGHIWDSSHDYDMALANLVLEEYIKTSGNTPIPAPHHIVPEIKGRGKVKIPTGRKTAKFPCTYCPYLEECHGKFELDWGKDQFGNGKPIYLFK